VKKCLFLLALLLASCVSKHTSPLEGPPRVKIKIPLMVDVERFVPFTLILQGGPWPETVGLEVFVDGEYVHGKGGIWAEKLQPIEERLYIRREWYLDKGWKTPSPYEPPDIENMEGGEVEVSVKIEFILSELEPHPTDPWKWKKGKRVASISRTIRLSCWNCNF